jgi:hypothetical protein
MGRASACCLALPVLVAAFLIPTGAVADPPCAPTSIPAPVNWLPSHYSPWHYKTPLLYRCWAEHHYGVTGGPCGPGCMGPTPEVSTASQQPSSAADSGGRSQGTAPATPAAPAPQQGP